MFRKSLTLGGVVALLCVGAVSAQERLRTTPVEASAVETVSATGGEALVGKEAEGRSARPVVEPVGTQAASSMADRVVRNEGVWLHQGAIAEPVVMATEEMGGFPGGDDCVLECEPNEGEPDCYDGYDDTYNSGCLYYPGSFLPLAIGDTICGTSGTYIPAGWPFEQPALDYYSITVTEDTELSISIHAEFTANAGLSVPHPILMCGGQKQQIEVLEWLTPCEEATITKCVPPGTYWFGINPTFGHGVPCGTKYEIAVTGQPCAAAAPENDTCDTAIEVSIGTTIAGDLLFAQPDELPECMINQAGVGVWYKVIGTGHTLTASTCSPNAMSTTLVSVFCGGCDDLFCVGGNSWDPDCEFNGAAVSWCSAVGETYYIRLTGESSDTLYEFAVMDDGVPCDWPAVCEPMDILCHFGDTLEDEPVCEDEYVDTHNGGCDAMTPAFASISVGETVCGKSGVYWRSGQPVADYDWYEVVLTEDTALTWAVQAEFRSEIVLWNGTGGCFGRTEIDRTTSAAYQWGTLSACIPAGTYWVTVSPDPAGPFVTCGARYRATLYGGPCSIPTGACCLLDGNCVVSTAEACEMEHGGMYRGDGESCEEVDCPVYAAADTCLEAVEVGIPSSTLGTTVMATFDNARTCDDLTSGQGVWFKVIGTGTTLTATTYGATADFASQLKVYCAGCGVQRCVGGDGSGCPFFGGPGTPNSVSWCSEMGREYLIFVHECMGSGAFYLDVVDDGISCAEPPACEPCVEDFVVTAPGSWSGNTCDAGDDCVGIGNGEYPDHIYEVVIPYDGMWVVSMCGSAFPTTIGIGTTCCSTDIALVEATQVPCQQPEFSGFLSAGTYYVSVEGGSWWPTCGDYTLRVFDANITCSVTCPAGATAEQEICGLQVNNGCEMMSPAFEPIGKDQSVYGSYWADAMAADGDWYEIELDERSVVTWTVETEVPTLVGMPGSSNPGDGECSSLTGQLSTSVISGFCQDVTLTTDVLPAGTHWFLIGPWLAGTTCDQGYVATVTWEKAPTGACCIHDGTCMGDTLEDECVNHEGVFHGVGSSCDEVTCEAYYCSASGVCDKYISHVQVGDIDHATECESYAFYEDVVTELSVDGHYPVSVTVPMQTGFEESCTVWVDWNQDRTFDDPGEVFALSGPVGMDETVFTGELTVPAEALPGATRMRVRFQWGQERLPCGEHWSPGEVEDYLVVVAPTLCGDLDGDADVDREDYDIFRSAFGGVVDADPPQDYLCDYNDDGVVGMADYAAFLACYRDQLGKDRSHRDVRAGTRTLSVTRSR